MFTQAHVPTIARQARATSWSATASTTRSFICECKFWGGERKLAETFEQLLGYTTWQDNRLALIFFVRNNGCSL